MIVPRPPSSFKITIVLLLLGIFCLLAYNITVNNAKIEHSEYTNQLLERYEMYDINISRTPLGIYVTDEYYVVWVKNRILVNIKETELHEACHDEIFQEYKRKDKPKHFCYRNESV